jgi:hypothetical protein
MNIHADRKGLRVVSLPTARRKRVFVLADGGWDYADLAVGSRGVVKDVESHGSDPYTRYSIQWDEGGYSGGTSLGHDFTWEV